MAAGTWIYEKGTTSGGGTFIPSDAPDVVIDVATSKVREIYDGQFEVSVFWTAGAGSTAENFKGVAVFLEDPDISELAQAPMDGTARLNSTAQVSGRWTPIRENDSFVSPAVIIINGKPKDRKIRVYLQAFGNVTNATLVRANKPNATPNIQLTIPAAVGKYVSGEEFTWLITNPTAIVITDFENPTGPVFRLQFSFTPPDPSIPLPPGLNPFAGVTITYEYPDEGGRRADAMFLDQNKPDIPGSDTSPATWISMNYVAATSHFYVYFRSTDVVGNVNTIVKDLTPMVDCHVTYPPAGQPSAPYITGLALANNRYDPQPDGTLFEEADLTWTNPVSPRFGGVFFYRAKLAGETSPRLMAQATGNVQGAMLQVIDWPKIAAAWTIYAISVDFNGKPSDDPNSPSVGTPRVTWNVGPPGLGGTGQEYTPIGGASGVTVTTEQQLNSDGVVMMRHKISGWTNPPDNTFGGMSIARVISGQTADPTWWDAQKNETSFTTAWEPAPAARTWDFYFVSRDMTNHRNTILPGVTPKYTAPAFTPIAGNIIPSRLPSGWWDPTEFQWPTYPSGYFQALQFVAKKIYVGSILRVGGGTGSYDASFGAQSNGQIAVYNNLNTLRAWIGQQDGMGTPDNPSGHSIYGGWFSELYVGGDNPTNAPFYAKQDGTVIVGGFEMSGSRYPYISIRDNTGIEVGRIGARIGYAASGNQSGSELTIQGAWFREFAYGGQSFTDWRLLAKMDASVPQGATVQMRNINKFFIDYAQNYNPGGTSPNPTNAAMHLEFGYDAFVTDGPGDPTYYKFPGVTLYRTGTNPNHGIAIINRGIILRGPNNVGGNSGRVAALVSFNGDSKGGDGGSSWWGELTMYSPTSGAINVDLGSGSAANGGSFLTMRDASGTLNFNVDNVGNVTIRGTLSLVSLSLSGNLSVSGSSTLASISGTSLVLTGGTGINCTGPITTNSYGITCASLNAGSGTGQFGSVFCSSVSAGSGVINCGSVNAGSGNVTCGTVSASGNISGPSASITGTTTTATLNATSQIQVNGSLCCDSSGIWQKGVQCVDHVYGGDFGIKTGPSTGFPGVTGPTTFTTTDGKTVTVRGGIITSIV
jgi:hypothetical protein